MNSPFTYPPFYDSVPPFRSSIPNTGPWIPPPLSPIEQLINEYNRTHNLDTLYTTLLYIDRMNPSLRTMRALDFAQANIHTLILKTDITLWEPLYRQFDKDLTCLPQALQNLSSKDLPQFVEKIEKLREIEETEEPVKNRLATFLDMYERLQQTIKEVPLISLLQAAYYLSQILHTPAVDLTRIVPSQFDFLKPHLTAHQIATFLQSLPIKDLLIIKVLLRCNQLCRDREKDTYLNLTTSELFRLAQCIETTIPILSELHNSYIKKETYFPKISRSMQFDHIQKAVHILLKTHYKQAFVKKGTLKKATYVFTVPFDTHLKPILIVQTVNRHFSNISIEENIDGYNLTMHDATTHMELSSEPGIWPCLGYFTYTKMIGKNLSIPKVMILTPVARGDLSIVRENKVLVSTHQLISVTYQLAKGLASIHERGAYHGDLKDQNALFKLFLDGAILAGLIDFGTTFPIPHGEEPLSYPLDQGYYGSTFPTAPELFGDKKFTGDLVKVEIFAFGYMLYSLLFKKHPEWTPLVTKHSTEAIYAEVTETTKQQMRESVTRNIDKPKEVLEVMLQNRELSLEENLGLLIYTMMQTDPQKRPSAEEIASRAKGLFEGVSLCAQLAAVTI